jgi:hypothetical protein
MWVVADWPSQVLAKRTTTTKDEKEVRTRLGRWFTHHPASRCVPSRADQIGQDD